LIAFKLNFVGFYVSVMRNAFGLSLAKAHFVCEVERFNPDCPGVSTTTGYWNTLPVMSHFVLKY
jgi:hypothetical protein